MTEYMQFWFAKSLVEFGVAMAVIALICVPFLLYWAYEWVKQAACPHEEVQETSACNAICRHCGKNLGFIGYWRAKQKAEE